MAASRKIYFAGRSVPTITTVSGSPYWYWPYDDIIDGSLVSPQQGDLIGSLPSSTSDPAYNTTKYYTIIQITHSLAEARAFANDTSTTSTWPVPCLWVQPLSTGGGGSSIYIDENTHKLVIS